VGEKSYFLSQNPHISINKHSSIYHYLGHYKNANIDVDGDAEHKKTLLPPQLVKDYRRKESQPHEQEKFKPLSKLPRGSFHAL